MTWYKLVMNKLPATKRSAILTLLCEGNSLRATSRIADVSLDTVTKLLVDAGKACHAFHDRTVRDVTAKRVQCDEIWAFTHCKQKNVATAKAAPADAGDVWTWTALEAGTKLIVGWLVGGRDAEYANAFMKDVAERLATRVQLTTDGHKPYLEAVEGAFGADVDYAMLVKIYGQPPGAEKRYSPAECIGANKQTVTGRPKREDISTSYIERQNLTMRMHMRRFTRLTNAFSKKVENHAYAVALHCTFYNFVRIHRTLRVMPAMAAGLTDRLWEMKDIVAMLEARETAEAPKKRGPYKPRTPKAV